MDWRKRAKEIGLPLDCDACWSANCTEHIFPPRVIVTALLKDYCALAELYEEAVQAGSHPEATVTSPAADAIRASIDALPEWTGTDAIVRTQPAKWGLSAGGPYVVTSGHGVVATSSAPQIGALVALLASPHVAAAVAKLLDALIGSETVTREWIDRVEVARTAAEAAILRNAS